MPLTTFSIFIIFVSVSEQLKLNQLFAGTGYSLSSGYKRRNQLIINLIMKQIKHIAIRLAIKIASNVIAIAYNPNQVEIFHLLLDLCEIVVS